MRTKGVLLLGFIVCCSVVGNAEDGFGGFLYDNGIDDGIGDTLYEKLAEDFVFRADDKCSDDQNCNENQKCVDKNGSKFCQCADGLSGDNCEITDWCEDPEKFKDCRDDNGKCEYDKGKRSVVCTCDTGKLWKPEEKKCKDTCSDNQNCKENQKCVDKNGWKSCQCADGLSGDSCEITDWCEDPEKFKDCRDDNGKCEYDKEKRSVVCTCDTGKLWKPDEKKCKDACSDDQNCKENQKCVDKNGWKSCQCADGLSGDSCEITDWCEDSEKFKDCRDDNGKCEYDKEKRSVVCTCDTGKLWKPDEKKCKDTCSKDDDCKDTQKCLEQVGWKSCQCAAGLSGSDCENKDWCEGTGKFNKCKGENGTCEYSKEKRTVVCTCAAPGRKLHPNENRCRETCSVDTECNNGGKCEEKDGGNKFCSCKLGLIGDKCQTVFDCTPSGKYKDCQKSGGVCKYNGANAICECSGNKKLHDKENICKDTCSKDDDCKDNQKCVEQDGWKSCQCAAGLSGSDCEKRDWCEGTGKFNKCKGENGTCEYSKEIRTVVCTCAASGRKLNYNENRCRETCSDNTECNYGGKCEENVVNKFCSCKSGLIGDKCQTVYDCSSNGKYKGCKSSGGECKYDDSKAICECSGNKKLHDKENVCKVCDCGPKGTCEFQNGTKICNCENGFEVKDGRCREVCDGECEHGSECREFGEFRFCVCSKGLSGDKCNIVIDCGANKKFANCTSERGSCEYDTNNKEAVCKCPTGKELNSNLNYCQETCNDDDCNGGQCVVTGDKKFCKCKDQLEGDKCEIVKDCVRGKYSKCKETEGECKFDGTRSTCICPESKKLDESLPEHICRKKCGSDTECKHGAKCKDNLCQCPPGTEDDDCNKVTACDTLNCEEKNAACTYDSSKTPNTFCVCTDSNYIFVEKDKKCVEKCKKDGYCLNGGKCNPETNLCECKKKTSGDKCEKIDGCDSLKCEDKKAKCIYNVDKEMPTCRCLDESYYFENGNCNPVWCKDGCNLAVSTCEYKDGYGICNCKTTGSYYNYGTKLCKKIDACFNMTCEDNQICKNGKCDCPENYQKKDNNCEPKDLCKQNLCFGGAQCQNGSTLGYVRCLCASPFFYNATTRKCDDGKCFLPDEKKNCTKPCPSGMTRNGGECKHDKPEKSCEDECGFLGWCEKVPDKENKCVCDRDYAELNKTTNKCVLKASVCPTKENDGDKCKCTGKYKQATNGITCDLRSCSDEDVQNECKTKRASKCVDNWKNAVGYKCECPNGYVDVKDKGCVDQCSLDIAKNECLAKGQVCYIGEKISGDNCRCPPTLTYDQTKKSCDLDGANTFMIHSLPVLKEKYKTVENNFNKVLLNIDVSTSMKTAFRNLDFVHVLNIKEDNAVLFCDVWLQFVAALPEKFNATSEVLRWSEQLREINQLIILVPALFLSSDHITKVKVEKLTLCTSSVQQSLCGTGSKCENNKCSCNTGYREIDSTIKSSSNKRIVRCEDIDECAEGTHNCNQENSQCVNTLGDYFCKCKSGFKKEKGDADAMDKVACIGLCDPNPCGKGTCQLTKEKTIDCTCPKGYTGSFCNREDVNLAKAGKATKVVGAVLGTLLAIVIILIIVYIVRQRKNSYSEDFTPAPRVDNAEMVERRPMRGVTNRAYQ